MAARVSRRDADRFRTIGSKRAKAVLDYRRRLVGVSRSIESDVVDELLKRFTVERGRFVNDRKASRELRRTRSFLDRSLARSGYFESSARVLGTQHELEASLRTAYQRTVGDRNLAFTRKGLARARALSIGQADAYERIGQRGMREIERSLRAHVRAGGRVADFREELKAKLVGHGRRGKKGQGLFRHAGTLAETGTAESGRVLQADLAERAGVTRFVYQGPRDEKNRRFCRRLVTAARNGRSWTRDQIDDMDNSPNGEGVGSVWETGGGWNCRHWWIPVADSVV